MAFLLKPYEVEVPPFRPGFYPAASPGKARADAWRAYCSYRHVTFGEFLAMSSVRRCDPPPRFGAPIVVGGLPGYFVPGFIGSYVRFVRPDSDTILCSHPNDVVRPEMEAA